MSQRPAQRLGRQSALVRRGRLEELEREDAREERDPDPRERQIQDDARRACQELDG